MIGGGIILVVGYGILIRIDKYRCEKIKNRFRLMISHLPKKNEHEHVIDVAGEDYVTISKINCRTDECELHRRQDV